ncbi:hypothetical protein [Actibacterium ureilyticum]|uniref:hypothetical protein n=1 Tax=Actibacterium ureilyticum TaxID=1590614 RepID=UPI001140F59D|nr:hypothetical protein [Actibacterium ureilyticum]
MDKGLVKIWGAATAVGLGHYGLTGLEDALVSMQIGATAMFGAIALEGINGVGEAFQIRKQERSNKADHDDLPPPSPGQ